ncbi:FAD-dependent oxidoreductase [Nakamurella sp. YIM 132087]|uniref:FAD-dependent oxidoreductase n=1 Tax=Nakamurella alba TaxID=2665158 RepID=A0A7K1FQ16_9ACTN|nr:FAD-dependent oxidoreductase [Nakamurella alba]
MPDRARIVVIGGGVGGASIAYHLAQRGERDVLLLERSELTSGSTFHSAGMVGQLRSDPTLTRMNMYSVELYRELQAGENPPGWTETGSIRLASSPLRLEELRRQLDWAQVVGLPMELITAGRAQELFPLMDTDGVLGGVYLPTDGHVDPSQLCYALAAGARAGGVRVEQRTRVTGIDVRDGRVHGVRTDRGDVACEIVVDAGGMFAAEIGRLAGVRIPLLPMAHQYLVTDVVPVPGGIELRSLPSLRDPDLLVYFRPEGQGLLMGGYERTPEAFSAGRDRLDAVPADFNGKLLAEDWERFAEIADNARIRVPVMDRVGVRRVINGPEAFTPDNEFCLGETDVDGFFVSAGFCAHGIAGAGGVGRLMADWVLDGRPSADVRHMDVARFGRQFASPSYTYDRIVENYSTYYDVRLPGHERTAGRPLRTSPAYPWHREHGAVFGEKDGWERVLFYSTPVSDGADLPVPRGWAGANFSPAATAEHLACRGSAAVFDESSFAKLRITGAEAAVFLDLVCDNRIDREVGAVVYTQLLNEHGGIEADVTVSRRGPEEFQLVTGTAFGAHDGAWLRRQARRTGSAVRIDDVTSALGCYALWGPRAREVLQPLTSTDLSDAAFPYLTGQELTIGAVPVWAQRVTYVGELGWEIYAPAEYGAGLWAQLAALPGVTPAGYRAIESLRLEKAYRAWGSDLTSRTTPLEAGLGFCVAWDKPDFLGKAALLRQREEGPAQLLRTLVVEDPTAVVLGGEPVRVDGTVVGRVTSGGYGWTVRSSIAFAYLPSAIRPGAQAEISMFGTWYPAEVRAGALHDPRNTAVRS